MGGWLPVGAFPEIAVARKGLHRRVLSIRLRLTVAGWLFLAVSLLVGVAAVKSQAPLMFVLFGVMMGSVMVSATVASRMAAAVRLRRDLPERAWQNQTIHLGYYLRNMRRRRPCMAVTLQEKEPEGIDSVAGYCVHLPARRIFRAGARFTPIRRGRIRLNTVELSTAFPFGFVRASARVDQPRSLVVWPARGRLTRSLLHRGAVQTSNAAPSPASGGQDEFFGLREYRAGDNPRWIHWRRSASRTTLVLREMARPLPEVLWIILETYWDDLSDVGQRSRERTLRFAATLIDHAFARGYQVGMALAQNGGTRVFEAAPGRGQRCELLDALADVDANTQYRLEASLGGLRRNLLHKAQVIVITARSRALPTGLISSLRTSCRHLTVLGKEQIDHVFKDKPPITEDSVCL